MTATFPKESIFVLLILIAIELKILEIYTSLIYTDYWFFFIYWSGQEFIDQFLILHPHNARGVSAAVLSLGFHLIGDYWAEGWRRW